jgi:hypothetical protein
MKMYQIEQLKKEKDAIAKAKSTGVFFRFSQAQRDVIRTVEKKCHQEGKPAYGTYSLQFEEIIQDGDLE